MYGMVIKQYVQIWGGVGFGILTLSDLLKSSDPSLLKLSLYLGKTILSQVSFSKCSS